MGKENIKSFHKKRHLNIGIVLFSFIFIYLLATIVTYLGKKNVISYEVRKGSIIKDMSYTAFAIREEKVVTSDKAGYVNYYLQNNSKVAKGTKLYTLSDEKLELGTDNKKQKTTLTSDEQYAIYMEIQDFNNRFQNSDFEALTQSKEKIEGLLQESSNQSKIDVIKKQLKDGSLSNVSLKSAKADGIVVYFVDGYEEVTADTITPEMLKKDSYQKTEFHDNRQIAEGDSLYKLVTSEKWFLFFEISEDTYETVKEKKQIRVNFCKDEQAMTAGIKVKELEGKKYALLSLSNAMIRYANDRYLDIELILEDETGLKIPKTAVTEKAFFLVPTDYISHGGNSSSDGVLRQTIDKNGKAITEFVVTNIYYEDTETGMVYLDPNVFHEGDVLLKENSNSTYCLQKKANLKGVYHINKGYAVFKQIHILCESDAYYIVEDGSDYGLSNYDHIALDATTIQENDIIF